MASLRKEKSRVSAATLARNGHRLIGPVSLLILLLFPVIFFVPLLRTKIWFLSYNEIILARVAYDLFYADKFLFVVVFVFGMLIPACKMVMSVLCWYHFDISFYDRHSEILFYLGKLSMLDVMLLAIFIVAFKGIGFGVMEIRYGLYAYVLLILGSFFLNLVMTAAITELRQRPANSKK